MSSENKENAYDTPGPYGEYLELALTLAREAGLKLLEGFNCPKKVTSKSSSIDVVTETDKACEDLIITGIRSRHPLHRFIAEESHTGGNSYDYTDVPTWLIDPVDGTTNFVHAFPFVCISIGLAINKEVVVGVVYNPVMQEMFHAVKGEGAYLNGRRLRTSTTADIGSAAIVTEFGYDRSQQGVDDNLARLRSLLLLRVQAIRSCGSCALNMCSVAAGRLDLYYEGKDSILGPKPWDFAASQLIVTEAGGIVCDTDGSSVDITSGRVMAANNDTLRQHVLRAIGYRINCSLAEIVSVFMLEEDGEVVSLRVLYQLCEDETMHMRHLRPQTAVYYQHNEHHHEELAPDWFHELFLGGVNPKKR